MTGKTLGKLKQLLKSNVRSPASSELNPADVAVYETIRHLLLYLLNHAVLTPDGKIPGMYDDIEEYDSFDSLPQPGESGKMYSVDGELYVWDGTEYKEAAGKDVVATLTTHVGNGDIHVDVQSVPVKTINDTWTCTPPATQFGTPFSVKWTIDATEGEGWALFTNDTKQGKVFTNADADTLTWSRSAATSGYDVTAVRVLSQQAYKINNGSSEKLQPAGDYATAKQNFEVRRQLENKVDKTLTVNGKALSGNISLDASDVGAATAAQGATADGALQRDGDTMTGVLHIPYGNLSVEGGAGAKWTVDWLSAFDGWKVTIKPENSTTSYDIQFPTIAGTLALTAGDGHTGNLAALDASGNPTNSGKSFTDIQNQIDTEAPLVARSFPVQSQTGWTLGEGNSSNPVYFRPRFFGMKDGDLLKGIVLRTRESGLTPFTSGVYMRLKRFVDGQTLGVSELTVWPNTANTDVVFKFPQAIELPSSDNYYTLDFSTTPNGAAVSFGMRLYVVPSGSTNSDFYFNLASLVPVSTAQFYSWEPLDSAVTRDSTNPVKSSAIWSAIYAIVQQLAPAFDATRTPTNRYPQWAIVSKDGVIYRCVDQNGHYGAWNDSNWEAVPVSDLFLPVLGGEKLDNLVIRGGGVKLCGNDGSNYWAIYNDALGIYLYDGTDTYYLVPNDGTRSGGGTFALTAGPGLTNTLAALDASGNPIGSGIVVDPSYGSKAVVIQTTDDSASGFRIKKPNTSGGGNSTSHVYSGVRVYRNGVLAQYTYDDSANGIARIQDLRYTLGGSTAADRSVRYIAVSGATQTLSVMPAAVSGKVRDFIVDVMNTSQATSVIDFAGLGDTWDAVVKSGESLSSMTTLAAGEMARFYFTETAFPQTGNRPVFLVVKDVVEAPSSAQATYSLNSDGTVSTEGEPNSDGTLSIEAVPNADGTVSVEAS